MEKVLIIGVIAIPLVLFLAYFGNNVMDNSDTNATRAKSEADALMNAVTN